MVSCCVRTFYLNVDMSTPVSSLAPIESLGYLGLVSMETPVRIVRCLDIQGFMKMAKKYPSYREQMSRCPETIPKYELCSDLATFIQEFPGACLSLPSYSVKGSVHVMGQKSLSGYPEIVARHQCLKGGLDLIMNLYTKKGDREKELAGRARELLKLFQERTRLYPQNLTGFNIRPSNNPYDEELTMRYDGSGGNPSYNLHLR